MRKLDHTTSLDATQDEPKGAAGPAAEASAMSDSLRDALAITSEGWLLVDQDEGRVVDADDRAAALLGAGTPQDLVGRSIAAFAPKVATLTQLTQRMIADRLESADSWAGRVEWENASGSVIEAAVRITAAPACDNHWLICVLTTRDTQAVHSRDETEAQWRTLVASVPDFISIHDTEGRYLFFNRLLAGLGAADILGRSLYDLVSPSSVDALKRTFENVVATGESDSCEVISDEPDGILRTWYSRMTPILRDGKVESVLLIVSDVTEQRRIEEELRERTTRFRLLSDYTSDLITRVDMSSRFIDASPSCERLLGYTRQELIGRNTQDFVHPDDLPMIKEAYGLLATHQDAPGPITCRVRHKNGTYVWLESVSALIENENGEPEIHAASRDVSQRERSERDLAQRREQLAHVWRLSAMGQMSASLAHEMSQPLTAAGNFLETARMRLERLGIDDARLLEDVDEAIAQVVRAGTVMRNIRGFVAPHDPHRETVRLNKLVQDTLVMLHTMLHDQQADVHLSLQEDLPPIRADEVQLQQVVLNLIQNACEAMQGVPASKRNLSISTRMLKADRVELTVHDCGPGLMADPSSAIFEPFYTTKSTGMGMGLAISRSIIRSHGGRLWGKTHDAGGSVFGFDLPVSEEIEDG